MCGCRSGWTDPPVPGFCRFSQRASAPLPKGCLADFLCHLQVEGLLVRYFCTRSGWMHSLRRFWAFERGTDGPPPKKPFGWFYSYLNSSKVYQSSKINLTWNYYRSIMIDCVGWLMVTNSIRLRDWLVHWSDWWNWVGRLFCWFNWFVDWSHWLIDWWIGRFIELIDRVGWPIDWKNWLIK